MSAVETVLSRLRLLAEALLTKLLDLAGENERPADTREMPELTFDDEQVGGTRLQSWQRALNDLLADAENELSAQEWRVLLAILTIRVARENAAKFDHEA